jgi:hypothetical protein
LVCSSAPPAVWHCASACSASTPVHVARKPRQKMPLLRKEAPSSIASSRPPTGAPNATATPAGARVALTA